MLHCHQNGSSFFSMFLPPRQMTAWCSPLGDFIGAWISLAWVPLVILYTYRLECVPQTLCSAEFISSGPHLEYKETARPHQMPPWSVFHCSIFPFLLFLASLSGSHNRDQTLLLEYYTCKGAGLHPPLQRPLTTKVWSPAPIHVGYETCGCLSTILKLTLSSLVAQHSRLVGLVCISIIFSVTEQNAE